MPLPFHYSSLNYELAQSTPSDSIRIMWNQLGEKMKADSIMYMTPNFDPSIGYTYPEFGIWGNNLLDPRLAVQQTMQAFQNGTWMQGNSTNWFNTWGGNNGGNWWNSWNPWGNGNNNGSSSSDPKYDALKAVLNKYIELNPNDDKIQEIRDAVNKSGKPEEKMDALKNVYKKLNKTKLQKALLDLPEYKKLLDVAGYNFNGMNKEEDKKLRSDLEKLSTRIKDKSCEYGGLVNPTADNILRTISYWNDSHNDDNSRGILKLIATNLKPNEDEKTKHRELVEKLTQALLDKAVEFKAEYEGSFPKLDSAKDAVADALAKITDNNSCTQSNVEALAKEFDKLYAMLRIMEAEKISNTIQTKYSFLNNIASNDVDFVNDDLVVKATKEDLKAEGVTIVDTDTIPKEEVEVNHDADDYSDLETAEEQIEKLVEKGHLVKTAKEGVYKTKTASTTGEATKFYTIKNDKLVELKNVKDIDKDGKCTMPDGVKKEMAEVQTAQVTAESVDQYNQTIKRIESLKGNKIEKCAGNNLPAGTVLYKSKGKDEEGNRQYFVIKDNKLMKINGIVYASGTVKVNGTNKAFNELTDSDFIEFNDSEIITEDLKAQKEQEAAAAAQKEAEEAAKAKAAKIPEINDKSTGYTNGKDVYSKLSGSTSDEEWNTCVKHITDTNKDTIRDFVAGYVNKRGSWRVGDNLLEQIATEYATTGCFGWGSTYRSGRRDLINHIVKTVLEYCEAHPALQNRDAYTKLKAKYNNGNGITADDINNHSSDKYNDDGTVKGIRGLDHLILDLLDINT